jgi:CheY-like chemotaxis protein
LGPINRTAIRRAHDDADSSKVSAMSDAASVKDVIIADNDYIIRGILRSVLENEGFTVLQTIDGFEAIDYATRTHACLVMLDYKMPRLDGISACAEIRRLPDYADTPIIILTAFDDEETRAAARQAGVTAFLAKPFKPVDLLRVISDLLGSSPAAGAAGPEPVALVWKRRQEPPPLFGEPIELSKGRRVLNICRR